MFTSPIKDFFLTLAAYPSILRAKYGQWMRCSITAVMLASYPQCQKKGGGGYTKGRQERSSVLKTGQRIPVHRDINRLQIHRVS